jgi:hypothetical protein
MNLLSGHKDLFEVAHGNLPCTQGVFISEQFEDGATFRQRASTVDHQQAIANAQAAGTAIPDRETFRNATAYADSATGNIKIHKPLCSEVYFLIFFYLLKNHIQIVSQT